MQDAIRREFPRVDDKVFLKAYAAALKTAGAAATVECTEENSGEYNAVTVPEVAHSAELHDADKTPPRVASIAGQQIIADRRLLPPVRITYVTEAEYVRHYHAVLDATRAAIENASREPK